MAIQNRRGVYKDFNPAKLLPGEWAVVTGGDGNSSDGTSIYVCLKTGVVKRMATYEDMQADLAKVIQDVKTQFTRDINQAIEKATSAENTASAAAARANAAAQLCEDSSKNLEDLENQMTQVKDKLKKMVEISGY